VYKWFVTVLAALSVLFLLAGMVALILPEDYEGQEVYRIDRMHAVRILDVLGGLLLTIGCIVAWSAGLVWQRRMRDS
jgi:drug/metabolite transporter (DMT)-like permease